MGHLRQQCLQRLVDRADRQRRPLPGPHLAALLVRRIHPNAVDLAPTAFGSCDHAQDGLCEFKYGGDYADPSTPPNEVWTNQLVLPIWSYLADPSADAAVALVQSPLASHAPVFARLTTRADGGVASFNYSREFSRLGNGSTPATFRQ